MTSITSENHNPCAWVPHNGTPTSEAAADAIAPVAASIRDTILELIRSRGPDGATADEIEAASGYRAPTVTPRVLELRRRGQVLKTDRTRATSSGRQAAVYVAMEATGS